MEMMEKPRPLQIMLQGRRLWSKFWSRMARLQPVGRPVASQDVELQRIALERHKLNFEIYKYALDKDLDFRALCDEIKRA